MAVPRAVTYARTMPLSMHDAGMTWKLRSNGGAAAFWEVMSTDRTWPLCKALHNGHYAKCTVMNSPSDRPLNCPLERGAPAPAKLCIIRVLTAATGDASDRASWAMVDRPWRSLPRRICSSRADTSRTRYRRRPSCTTRAGEIM